MKPSRSHRSELKKLVVVWSILTIIMSFTTLQTSKQTMIKSPMNQKYWSILSTWLVSLLLIQVQFSTLAQGVCTVTGPDGIPISSVVSGNDALCNFLNGDCRHAIIHGCDTVDCTGMDSCKFAQIFDSTLVKCNSEHSCEYAKVSQASKVQCTAVDSCIYARMVDVDTLECLAEACQGAEVQAKSVTCSGFGSCLSTMFLNSETILCNGQNSCAYCQILKAETVSCNGSDACLRAHMKANTVTCQGTLRSCRGLKDDTLVINACELNCQTTTACGNILFIDRGTPGAAPVIVETNKILKIGSGCPASKAKPGCFSGSNLVETQGKGLIPMSSLEVGDLVQSGNGSEFSYVLSLMHSDPYLNSNYIQIYTEALDAPLEISRDHLLYIRDESHQVVAAKDIKVGDIVDTGTTVTKIGSVQHQGVYAPLTESGDLWVSGTHVSCYISLMNNDLLVPPSIQTFASHALLAPLRMVCALDFSICKNEDHSNMGFSTNLEAIIKIGLQLKDINSCLQMVLFIMVGPLLMVLVAIEKAIIHFHGVLATVALGFMASLYFPGVKK